MNALNDWPGKADDLSISYEAGIEQNQLMMLGAPFGDNLPAIAYSEFDNIRDVTDDITWEKTVSKADRMDYMMAICSGTISGLIDVFYVGEFSLERANEWGTKEVNKFVRKVAELQGFKGEDLSDAIKHLKSIYDALLTVENK